MEPSWAELEKLMEELVEGQKKHLLKCGQRLLPTVTLEDLLQPNDFPELENHPIFRYEEGLLAGIQTVQTAVRALREFNKT